MTYVMAYSRSAAPIQVKSSYVGQDMQLDLIATPAQPCGWPMRSRPPFTTVPTYLALMTSEPTQNYQQRVERNCLTLAEGMTVDTS